MSEDERRRRRASERAVDPVSRVLLATAEGHQEYIDQMGQAVPWWHHWLYYWVVGGVDVFAWATFGVFFWMQGVLVALPLSVVPLALGGILLAWPWIRRNRGQDDSRSRKKG